MRGLLLVGISMIVVSTLAAQQAASRATRSDGSVVLLYANGTWKPDTAVGSSKPSGGSYRKAGTATSSVDLLKGASLAYDPTKWTLLPSDKLGGRRQLNHREGDGYALIFAERLQMPMATLKNIVLQNARTAAPDAKVVREEQRTVNGVSVTCMELAGTTHGIPFRYFGYYYAGKAGTIQVITYTGESLFPEYRDDFEELLNGFTVQ
jgi:hypothetical protein